MPKWSYQCSTSINMKFHTIYLQYNGCGLDIYLSITSPDFFPPPLWHQHVSHAIIPSCWLPLSLRIYFRSLSTWCQLTCQRWVLDISSYSMNGLITQWYNTATQIHCNSASAINPWWGWSSPAPTRNHKPFFYKFLSFMLSWFMGHSKQAMQYVFSTALM